ncbi:hypothetical protein TH25_20630 [Thalassospira profundimaris]|uniref:AB hydrolase-1 domain-containing protein n=1 Tax=Thalassospira profundimaris TaxID=502049 RepID=A0A367WR61_9PROT|nr:alpha/beta fold hydrolase [Thalassospira profundimaris]RCK43857.1 hypothetical protein TH25_20630 [Thalassospira profundimaris]
MLHHSQIPFLALLILGISALSCTQAHADQPRHKTGFQKLEIPASDQGRALSGAIWYPTENGSHTAATLIADNAAFVGEEVIMDAATDAPPHPLVVLSHGFGGNWRNQIWLATSLVQAGYIVAAINHPGTTSRDLEPVKGARLWQRPADISHLITALERNTQWGAHIDTSDISAIGHSLGGWTVMELAGARMDADKMAQDCQHHPELAACDVVRDFAVGKTATDRRKLKQDLRDPRIKRVISLDLGLARGFSNDSLAHITIPTLVIAAGSPNPKLPAKLESRYLFDHLPAKYRTLTVQENAAHFSFLQTCKPNAINLLEAEKPGDGIICKDGLKGDRRQIHQEITQQVLAFLARH